MANRSFQRLQALDKEIKIVHGQFAVGGSGAPTLSASKSVGVKSITRNSAGDYSFQLKGAPTVSTNGTINFIALNSSGAAAEIGSGETVHFMIVLKNSSLPGVGVS